MKVPDGKWQHGTRMGRVYIRVGFVPELQGIEGISISGIDSGDQGLEDAEGVREAAELVEGESMEGKMGEVDVRRDGTRVREIVKEGAPLATGSKIKELIGIEGEIENGGGG